MVRSMAANSERRNIDLATGKTRVAHLGRLNEARAAAEAGIALSPTFTIASFRANAPNDNSIYLTQRERIIEDMRKAGVPEG
jgi:hypothetical protein